MKKIKTILAILPALLFSCAGDDVEKYIPPTPITPSEPGEEVVYHKRAKELFDVINQCYRINSGATEGLYNENYPKKDGDNAASFLWPYDGLVSGAAALHALGYDVNYTDMVNRFDVYYRTSSGNVNIGGYGSSTNGTNGGGTRYYDDNSIVGIDLVEAFSLTQDPVYLAKAKQIVEFLKSGEDNTFGGGLWWNEDEKNIPGNENSNKPTCANGNAILFLLNYYSVCPQDEKADVLDFAKRLYNWTVTNLRDPADGCYWNDKQASGSIREVKWTYNTGAMISNGVRLHKITGEQSYLDSAIESSEGAYNYFVRPLNGLALAYPDHDPWFTTKLVRAYIDIEPYYKNAGNYIKTFINFLDYAYENARMTNGLYYEDWSGASPKRAEQLLMQDAALESLGIIALYKGETAVEE
ncbi:glycoside hydrolase family 76 protein [uncultured Bacteroides sp.]|uniref:glycoside hydrolase family 76 protein n=1 Tax=uncultured Bacteroides sp. TaxID=162156 RepID=UPI0025E36E25|nr:glycoside hydrolase family 76 protein [uncultured Bacteroides sp.]